MSLLTFQNQALAWLSSRPSAFLGLEQGLGKTVVASCDIVAPAIVVCPASMKFTWAKELSIWRPELRVQVVRKAKDLILPADVHVINYDILDKVVLPAATTLVCDESHYAKNPKAKRTKYLVKLIRQTERVRLLSGTPIVNRPIEIWPLLYAIKGTKLGYFEFGMKYCAGWKTPWDTYDFSGASKLAELQKMLEPVMLRLTKEQVLPELPEKTWRVVELDLPVDKREKTLDIEAIEKNPEPVAFEALADILKMNALRKLPLAIQHIKDALESTRKVVVFAHHTEIVSELMGALAEYKPVRVVGADSPESRQLSVERFQTDPECRVFVGNIKAAGVGLTLTAASRVIFVESSWTPADLQQCADRCHRIGQKNPVLAEILTIYKSIDSHMLHSALGKMHIINQIIKETNMTELNNSAIASKLRELADVFEGKAAPQAEIKKGKVEHEAKAETKAAEAKTETKAAEPTTTIDNVRDALAKLIDAGKRDVALKVLTDHGAAKVGELKAENFESVVKAINKALA